MKPPKFNPEDKIEDKNKYISPEEIRLYDMGWRKTTTNHWTDVKTGRLDKDHMPEGYEVSQINMSIPVSDADHMQRSSNGGKEYGENEHKRKTLRDRAQALLSRTLPLDKIAGILEISEDEAKTLGLEGADAGEILTLGQWIAASRGQSKAAEFIRDTAGEKPVNTQEISVFTDADKELCRKLAARMGINDEEPQ